MESVNVINLFIFTHEMVTCSTRGTRFYYTNTKQEGACYYRPTENMWCVKCHNLRKFIKHGELSKEVDHHKQDWDYIMSTEVQHVLL